MIVLSLWAMTMTVRPLDKCVDGLLHLHLVFRVERCGRFVQQNDRRILQYGTGDGYALLLAAGERATAFAHHRVVSLRQAHDEIVAAGFRPPR